MLYLVHHCKGVDECVYVVIEGRAILLQQTHLASQHSILLLQHFIYFLHGLEALLMH